VSSGQYFADDPSVGSDPRPVEIALPDVAFTLTADRGVFSADHLDAGTKFLLLEAPPLTSADAMVLDLGCGWGPIACVAAARAPQAAVWAVDVNERARHLTELNAAAIGAAEQIRVATPESVPADVRFDRILSNPPIRIGKHALHDLMQCWLPRLTPNGCAHLVVQKHLGSDSLASWLRNNGYDVDRIKSRAGFRILEVRPEG
jgi:16S rRNA G1207 methylase RsmC